jgi:hypothetical protein
MNDCTRLAGEAKVDTPTINEKLYILVLRTTRNPWSLTRQSRLSDI